MMNRRGEEILGNDCKECKGPCKVPKWVIYAGGSNYANNPERQELAIAKAHRWFTGEHYVRNNVPRRIQLLDEPVPEKKKHVRQKKTVSRTRSRAGR